MKYFLKLFFCFFIISRVYGQKNTINIQWANSKNLRIDRSDIDIKGASTFFVDESNYTEQLISSWERDGDFYEGAKAVNVRLESVSSDFFKSIEKKSLPKKFEILVASRLARGKSMEVLSFSPLVNQSGVIKRVISFDLQKKRQSSIRRSARNFQVPSRSSSILASGEWKRFAIDTTGVYKVTAQFLESIGVNLNGVNPQTIKIYGTGGKPLPYVNEENRFYDIPEVQVKMVGGADGVFSGTDYLLFYGIGTQGYDVDNDTNLNPFSREAFYYVTTGGGVQRQITAISESDSRDATIISDYDFETYSEKDITNIGGIGRKWFGDKFDGNIKDRNYRFEIPNPVAGSDITVDFFLGGVYANVPGVEVTITAGETVNRSFSFQPNLDRSTFAYGIISRNPSRNPSRITLDASSEITMNLAIDQRGDPSSEVYLDYVRVFGKSNLRGIGRQFSFSNERQNSASGVSEFRISNARNISSVWDVTDPYAILEKKNDPDSRSGLREENFNIRVASGAINNFVAIDEQDFYLPKRVNNSEVSNQDLKGNIFRNNTLSNSQGDVEYLIVTRSDFVGSANRLANFRRNFNGFNAKVVTVDQIYNEFSTGIQDISAIRNFIKYIYDNANDPSKRLKFVCFLGDGSFDYQDRLRERTNIVPLYYAENSRSFATSFASDDFYGMMDAEEGGDLSRDLLDIAVGRIVAPTPEIADDMVSKILRYYERDSFGPWRNNFLFVSDDVDPDSRNRGPGGGGLDGNIELKLDFVAEQLKSKLTNANVSKIFTDAFRQVATPAGNRYPIAKRDFLNTFESGAAYINYFGHGGEEGLSGEFIFRSNDARDLTNRNRLTVFTTLTCELTRFDNPLRETAGELLYWNKNGGAVALLTTTRNLFVSTGLALNPSLADALFTDNQEAVPIGEALRVSKNELTRFGANKRTVFCIGDPALEIIFPKPKILLTDVNEVSVFDADFDAKVGSLKALSRVRISGRVVDSRQDVSINAVTGEVSLPAALTNFNGDVVITLFDKIEVRETLGNDGVMACWEIDEFGDIDDPCDPAENRLFTIEFENSGNRIFNGRASVKEGIFNVEFVVSKNIKLPLGEGKISFYAQDSRILKDQGGSAKISIGGLNTEAVADVEPPVINLFLNNENFLDGQLVSSTPNLIARFSDENGINTAGGVGHDILVVIDGDERNPINLNEFYVTELDDFTRGVINFRLKDLAPGEHTLSLRASDVFNNVSIQEITFVVGSSDQFTVSEVLNYPNPFTSYTEFWFSHTGPQEDVLEVTIHIMSISGKIVTSKFATLAGNTNSYRGDITWDGKDNFGNKVGKGVYIYKISVKSTLTEKTFSKLEKLVVL